MAIFNKNLIRVSTLIRAKSALLCIKGSDKRFIMATHMKLEKALEDLERNPYFEKYANKIARLQETSPKEFLQQMESQETKARKQKEKQEAELKFYQSQAKPQLDHTAMPQQVQLDSIMKVDMIKNKNKDEIANIWKDYHKDKDYICGILTSEQFDKMFERGKHYSTFLLPLPRKQGYEFILLQFCGLEIHMTPLLWYQAHKENAPECLKMVHYVEFKNNKGIILMRGEFDKNCLNVQEAQCLANELQLYYCTDNPQRLQLLETFSNKPDEFKHMDLIAQLETIQLELQN